MDHGVAAQVETGGAAAVEHVDLGRVADAEQGLLQGDGIVHAQLADLLFGHGHVEFVVGHDQNP